MSRMSNQALEVVARWSVISKVVSFYRAILSISAVYAGMLYPSVRLPVTFVDLGKRNKHIFDFFSPPGSHTVLVFPHQTE